MYFTKEFIQKLYRLGLLLVIILVIIDLLTFFYYPETVFGDIFLATREQTPLTWLSSLAFLFIGLCGLSVYLESREKKWYFISAIFLFFSMDDATYFHERLSGFFIDNTGIFDFFSSYIWVIIYFPMLIFALGTFAYIAWKEACKIRKKYIIIALSLLGLAIFLDFLDGFFQKNSSLVFCFSESCNLIVLHLMRLSEEVLEVLALGILGYMSILRHCVVEKTKKVGFLKKVC